MQSIVCVSLAELCDACGFDHGKAATALPAGAGDLLVYASTVARCVGRMLPPSISPQLRVVVPDHRMERPDGWAEFCDEWASVGGVR